MPTYEYRCGACEHQFERFQKMSDQPVTECEVCGAGVQRVLFPVAVHFKGSGFYTTDYGKKKTLKGGSGNGSEADGSDSGSEPKSEAGKEAGSSAEKPDGNTSKAPSKA